MPLGSADSNIDVFTVHGKAVFRVAPKIFELHLTVLVQGADPGVEGCDFSSFLIHCGAASDRKR